MSELLAYLTVLLKLKQMRQTFRLNQTMKTLLTIIGPVKKIYFSESQVVLANSSDPDEKLHNVALHQALHCLPKGSGLQISCFCCF